MPVALAYRLAWSAYLSEVDLKYSYYIGFKLWPRYREQRINHRSLAHSRTRNPTPGLLSMT